MFRLVSIIILSAVLLAGCAGAGEFGTQMGVFPRSNIPILGGGEKSIGNRVVHTKTGDEIKGWTCYDSRTDTYIVYSGVAASKTGTTIPADQVAFMESY